MARTMPATDIVFIGVGFTAGVIARELKSASVRMVGLERGRDRQTVPDWQSPAMHDELNFAVRHGLMQDLARETVTFRNNPDQHALPYRQMGSFLPGSDLGGAGVHWNGQTWRFQESDFRLRSHHEERYGKNFIPDELSIQDWGITYQELEPYYDRFEHVLGVGGYAGNVGGAIRPGGNPFEAPRRRDWPNPPTKPSYLGTLFAKASMELGYSPFQVPSANMTRAYTNTEGLRLEPCMVCGYCERFGCEHFAKSSPQTTLLPAVMQQGNFELRTGSHVVRVNLSEDKQRATGVTYIDVATGEERIQPAEIVVLSAWAFHNPRLMLLSGIGKPYDPATGEGTIGRNYAYQTMSAVTVFYEEDVHLNQFMGAGALGTAIDDFGGDNFDHGKLGFVGGAYIAAYTTGARPIEFHPVPPGTPRWGLGWKEAVARHYNHTGALQCHGQSNAARNNYVDLDPTYKDAYGQPLLRVTFDFPENDVRFADYVNDRAVEIARRMGGRQVVAGRRTKPYSVVPYQTTHNTGGAIMGANPRTSACNRYGQSWDVANVFVTGTALFPQNAAYNPTDTVGALAHWTGEAIRERYLTSPGPLVPA